MDLHTESDLWNRLKAGRMRLAASVKAEARESIVTADQEQTVMRTMERSITLDEPMAPAILQRSGSG